MQAHYGHTVQKLDEIFNQKVNFVSVEAEAARNRSLQLKEETKKFDKLVASLSKSKQQTVDQLKDFFTSSQDAVEQQANERLALLQSTSLFSSNTSFLSLGPHSRL